MGATRTTIRYEPPTVIVGRDGSAYSPSRPLRKLRVDVELLRRRAQGESLRSLAADYDVAPSTLSRYFARIEGRA